MSSNSAPPARKSHLARFLRPIIVVPLVVLSLTIASPFLIREYYKSQIPLVDLPLDSIRALLDPSKPRSNARDSLLKAIAAIEKLPFPEAKWRPEHGGLPGISSEFAELLREHDETFVHLKMAFTFPWEDLISVEEEVIDLSAGLLMDFRVAEHVGRFLAGRIQQAIDNGDVEGSIDAYLLLLRISIEVDSTEILDCGGANSLSRIACEAIEEVCRAEIMTSSELKRLQLSVEEEIRRNSSSFAKKLLIFCFLECEGRWIFQEDGVKGPLKTASVRMMGSQFGNWLVARKELYRLKVRQYVANVLPYVDQPIWDQPPFSRGDGISFPYNVPGGERPKHGMSLDQLKECDDATTVFCRFREHLRVQYFQELARRGRKALLPVFVAIYRFQKERGVFPRSLDELVPEFIGAIPDDPCSKTRTLVKYRLDVEDFVLWSNGGNLKDEGGVGGFDVGKVSASEK